MSATTHFHWTIRGTGPMALPSSRFQHDHAHGNHDHDHDGTVYRYDRGTSAQRDENRLTGDDLMSIAARIAQELDSVRDRPVTIADDFNRVNRLAPRAIGCTNLDLRESELFEVADMVAAAILDRSAVSA